MFKNLNASALGVSGHQSEIIELALTYGFQGMDLDLEDSATRVKLHGMPYARRLIDSAAASRDFRLGSFELPIEWDTDDEPFKKALVELASMAQTAAEMGCTRCVATIAPAGDKRPLQENFEFHKHRFGDMGRVLESTGVRVGLRFRAAEELRQGQAFQFIHDWEGLTQLVGMINSPAVGVALDTWDMAVSGATVENLRTLSGDQIVQVCLADLPEGDAPATGWTEDSRLMPGTGVIDLAAILATLSKIGYRGPVTAAPSRASLKTARRDAIVEMAGQKLDQIWKAAGLASDGSVVFSITPTDGSNDKPAGDSAEPVADAAEPVADAAEPATPAES